MCNTPCVDCYPSRNNPSTCRNSTPGVGTGAFYGHSNGLGDSASSGTRVTNSQVDGVVGAYVGICSQSGTTEGQLRQEDQLPSYQRAPRCSGSQSSRVASAHNIPVPGYGQSSFQRVLGIYNEVVHWKKAYFTVPCGSVGKAFVI
eukprot:scpid89768/ scgid14205/ 